MVENLVSPFEAATIYIILTVGFLLTMALWLGWRISRLGEKPRLAGLRIYTWRRRIDRLDADHRSTGDTRVYFLALAKLLRDFGTERSGTNMASMSASDIERVSGEPGFARLLRELEEPSFSPGGGGASAELTERAKASVGSW